MRVARVVGAIGRTLIGVGVLLLLFVAYQLWGTGIQESRAQDRLGDDFRAALATTTTTDAPSPVTGPATPSTTRPVDDTAPPPVAGDPVAQIEIPEIGLQRYVVEGVGVADLKKGPGHYPQTPLPGQAGNAAIAGHRTTYGAPFDRLDDLELGDEIVVRTLQGTFTYLVDDILVVDPGQVEVLDPTSEARLTLTTCEPRFSARKRLIVTAVMRDEQVPAPAPATTTTRPSGDGAEQAGVDGAPDPAGLSGDPAARWPTFWWGLWTALVALAVYGAGRRWRVFWAYLAGAPFFFVLLFVFFENVSRLLPANI